MAGNGDFLLKVVIQNCSRRYVFNFGIFSGAGGWGSGGGGDSGGGIVGKGGGFGGGGFFSGTCWVVIVAVLFFAVGFSMG